MAVAKTPKPEELIAIRTNAGDALDGYPTVFRPAPGATAEPRRALQPRPPEPRAWQPSDEDWKLPETGSRSSWRGWPSGEEVPVLPPLMDICVRCGRAPTNAILHRLRDPKNMRSSGPNSCAPSTVATSPNRESSSAGSRAPVTDDRRPQGVVLLLLPVYGVPPLLGLCPYGIDRRRSP